VYRCDFHSAEFDDAVKDNSVDLIFTDLPWDEEHVPLHRDFAEFAARKLKPSVWVPDLRRSGLLGSCARSYVRTSGVPHLCGIRYTERKQPRWQKNIANGLQPIVLHQKPPITKLPEMRIDLIDGHQDKTYHPWGQGQREAIYFVNMLTAPGDLVVDPACGGGTIPTAAKKLSRKWIACNSSRDLDYAAITRDRVADTVPFRPEEYRQSLLSG